MHETVIAEMQQWANRLEKQVPDNEWGLFPDLYLGTIKKLLKGANNSISLGESVRGQSTYFCRMADRELRAVEALLTVLKDW